ncbi:uncharacterized protein LOC134183658 [Corticium candelabrum]|uniref:uncharacterized protein LOC134183658 n=1 Tax=Corticium candelabrum TaxID=121492 RepID=UPI002E259E6C|nr:uncharacterized protein LOC134183658 [Corticium candelabrum]
MLCKSEGPTDVTTPLLQTSSASKKQEGCFSCVHLAVPIQGCSLRSESVDRSTLSNLSPLVKTTNTFVPKRQFKTKNILNCSLQLSATLNSISDVYSLAESILTCSCSNVLAYVASSPDSREPGSVRFPYNTFSLLCVWTHRAYFQH